MINRRHFHRSLLVTGVGSLLSTTACRDYTCHDTATCPTDLPDAGRSNDVSTDSVQSSRGTQPVPAVSSTGEDHTTVSSAADPSSSASTEADPTSVPADSSNEVTDDTAAVTSGSDTTGETGLALGATCRENSECASGSCANEVCCETPCDGPCEACSADGVCDEMPEDDDTCEPVICPASTTCVSYPAAKETDRCGSLGQCLTPSEYCVPEFEEQETACGSGLECDGAGQCVSVCASGQVWCDDRCLGERSCKTWRRSESIVEVSRAINQTWASINETGDAVALWIEYTADNQVSKDLWARFYDRESNTWSSPSLVHTTTTYMANVTVAPDGSDGFIVLWDESIDATIKARRWNGSAWDTPTVLAPKASNAVRSYPSDGHSSILVYWSEYDDSTQNHSLRARTWNHLNGTWGASQTLQTGQQHFGELVATIADGTAFLVWQRAPAVTPNDWELWGSRLSTASNTWSPPVEFGSALERQSGFGLVLTPQGDLIGYLAGRLKGVIWDSSSAAWVTVTSSGDWFDFRLCPIGSNNALVTSKLEAQRWNRASGWIEPALQLPSNTVWAQVHCASTTAVVTSFDGTSNQVDRWDETTGTWLPSRVIDKGQLLDTSIGPNGSALFLRSADHNGNASPSSFGLEAEMQY